MGDVRLVMARELIPTTGSSVFLAGPSPALGSDTPSWRPEAVEALRATWRGRVPLIVLSPESRNGVRAERYEQQVFWEMRARSLATVVMYWIPRDVEALPGFTTNVEFGFDAGRNRLMVLGAPPDCPNPERNEYLIFLAGMEGAPVRHTLADTAAATVELINMART